MIPALAAEDIRFSDVPAGSWFERGVATCVESGVMEGVGNGLFAPDRELSAAECRALAYRLYDIRRGGDGAALSAPEEWGYITLTVDGKTFGAYSDPNMESSVGWGLRGHDDWRADGTDYPGYALPAAYLSPEWARWAWSVKDAPAVMRLNGAEYSGKASYGRIYGDTVQISFLPDGGEAAAKALNDGITANRPGPNVWWRDLAYTIESQLGVMEYTYNGWDEPASRADFANAVAGAAEDLPRLYTVGDLPDLERYGYYTHNEKIFDLYDAGVLTGSDEYGSFGYYETLTRAQAAVIAARMLDEDQRVRTPPRALPYLPYTLTEITVPGWEFNWAGSGEGADWLPVWRYCQDGEHFKDCAIYRADGTVFYEELEGGAVWGSPTAYDSGDSRYAHVERRRDVPGGGQEWDHGIFDVETGRLAADYGSYEDYLTARQALKEETEYVQWDGDRWLSVGRDSAGNAIAADRTEERYYNLEHIPVTPRFYGGDVGPVGSDGKGFVWWKEKVYRIQFD